MLLGIVLLLFLSRVSLRVLQLVLSFLSCLTFRLPIFLFPNCLRRRQFMFLGLINGASYSFMETCRVGLIITCLYRVEFRHFVFVLGSQHFHGMPERAVLVLTIFFRVVGEDLSLGI